jgi:hypothetical protein
MITKKRISAKIIEIKNKLKKMKKSEITYKNKIKELLFKIKKINISEIDFDNKKEVKKKMKKLNFIENSIKRRMLIKSNQIKKSKMNKFILKLKWNKLSFTFTKKMLESSEYNIKDDNYKISNNHVVKRCNEEKNFEILDVDFAKNIASLKDIKKTKLICYKNYNCYYSEYKCYNLEKLYYYKNGKVIMITAKDGKWVSKKETLFNKKLGYIMYYEF